MKLLLYIFLLLSLPTNAQMFSLKNYTHNYGTIEYGYIANLSPNDTLTYGSTATQILSPTTPPNYQIGASLNFPKKNTKAIIYLFKNMSSPFFSITLYEYTNGILRTYQSAYLTQSNTFVAFYPNVQAGMISGEFYNFKLPTVPFTPNPDTITLSGYFKGVEW